MEFMPQPNEVMSSSAADNNNSPENPSSDNVSNQTQIEEESIGSIGAFSNASNLPSQLPQLLPPPPQQQPEQAIYFSDGVMYPSQLNPPPSSPSTNIVSDPSSQNALEQTVALPDNLLEVYNNLGLVGKLLTSGSILTIRFLQSFRTLGESLVDVLGITKPKYDYEYNLARQMQEAEVQREQKLNELYAGWQQGPSGAQQSPPQPPPQVPPMSVVNMDSSSINMKTTSTSNSSPLQSPIQYPPPPPVVPIGSNAPQIQPPPPSVPQQYPPQVPPQ